jgi:putative nucleotidyltransferase with HDIG domain
MRIRVPIEQLRVGMFVHAVDASWLRSPFWRYRFLLSTADDLAELRSSGIASVVIDTERGLGLDQPRRPPENQIEQESEALPLATAFDPLTTAPLSLAAERRHARDVIDRSKRAMRAMFDGARLGRAVRSGEVVRLVDEISASITRNRHALIGMVRLKSKDEYTYLHSVAVCALMISLARQLALPEHLHRDLGLAGLLHDIGKMGVPDPILNKPGQLSEQEFAIVRSHPQRGARILEDGEGVPEVALDVCRHHHERVDGAGYPHGLAGDALSLPARMGAICDVYDALTSNRAYKEAWTPVQAVTAMWGWDGQFDRAILFAFFQAIGVYPVGLLVRTRSGALAIILPNGRRATRTRLRIFYRVDDDKLINPIDAALTNDEAEGIIDFEEPESWSVPDWAAFRGHLLREAGEICFPTLMRLWRGAPAQLPADGEPPRFAAWQPRRLAG